MSVMRLLKMVGIWERMDVLLLCLSIVEVSFLHQAPTKN